MRVIATSKMFRINFNNSYYNNFMRIKIFVIGKVDFRQIFIAIIACKNYYIYGLYGGSK